MKRFRSHRLYAPVVTVTLMAFVAACTNWKPVPLEPERLPPASTVRATLHAGEQVTLKSPVISGDTLRSAVRSVPSQAGVRFSDLRSIEVEKSDPVAIVVGVVAVGVVALALIAKSIKFGDMWCGGTCAQ
jgi:hypothetical protein